MQYDLVALDAFSSGQLGSKIWLADELVNYVNLDEPQRIWLLGGWYAVTNNILSIKNFPIEHVVSFDIDPAVANVACKINKLWHWHGRFSAITQDINTIQYTNPLPHIVINTSVEHIKSHDWFNNIPAGILVVLQSNNMDHDDHHVHHNSVDELVKDYPMSRVLYTGGRRFDYDTWSFTRWMVIGIK